MHDYQTFDRNDAEYHIWLAEHQNGYVLNLRRNPSPTYSVLHRAGCHTISSQVGQQGKYTERSYIKVCADVVAALVTYVSRLAMATGAHVASATAPFPKPCGLCAP